MPRTFVKPLMGLVVCCLWMTGCGEEDLTSIAITLNADGSGTVRLAGLRVPTQPAAFEQHAQGVEFDDRGRVQFDASMGGFSNIESLNIGGITFSHTAKDGSELLVVTVPRDGAAWAKMLAPSERDRTAAAAAFAADGKMKRVGDTIKISITVPRDVLAANTAPYQRGVSSKMRKNQAILLLPAETAEHRGTPLKWHITWYDG